VGFWTGTPGSRLAPAVVPVYSVNVIREPPHAV
jgi:hypothetical protein